MDQARASPNSTRRRRASGRAALGRLLEDVLPKGVFHVLKGVDLSVPQALRLTISPLTNRTIAITKGTALGS